MRKAKLIEDYSKIAFPLVSDFAHSVIRQTSASPFIKLGKDLVEELAAALSAYDADVDAIDHPDPSETANRNMLRMKVTDELGRLAKRLNLDYPGNEAALLSSGLTLVNISASNASRPVDLNAPVMVFDLLDGMQLGCLLLKLTRPTGTVQNLIRYTTDPTLPEDQWHVAVGGGRERQLGPFPSGTKVYVKVAALTGSTTEPVYSAIKSRIVQ